MSAGASPDPMAHEDRALQAVTRVRAVRERDSRVGLGHAVRAVQERTDELERRERELAAAPAFTTGPGGAFLADRVALAAMAADAAGAAERLESGRAVAAEALARWQDDRARLRSAELLAQRRAERQRAERQRAERREGDDMATQAWLREQDGEQHP